MKKLLIGTGLTFARASSGVFIITRPVSVRPRALRRVPGRSLPLPERKPEHPPEIMVTSRKREERAISVPVAVWVANGAGLEQRGVRSIAEILQESPGVGMVDRGNGLLKVTIRGISTSLGSNENGYYIDDLPFSGVTVPITPDVRAWDLERVEVLRGPQGTLFGEGSMGGTVRILTKGVGLTEWEAKANAYASQTEDGGTNSGLKGALNVPILPGVLAVRMAGTAEYLPGWIDSDLTGRANVNDQTIRTYRVKARFDPTARLSVNASFSSYDGSFPGGDSNATDSGQQSRLNIIATDHRYELSGISAHYDLGNIEAFYGYSHGYFHLNQTGISVGHPLHSVIDIQTDAHEIRLSSSASRHLNWTLGGFLRDARRYDLFQYPSLDIDYIGHAPDKTRAIFGEAVYTLPDTTVDLSAGVRYFRERIGSAASNSGVLTRQTGNSYTSWNPRFSIAWHPDADATIYVSAAKGFRGGQLQPTSIRVLAEQSGLVLPERLVQDSIWSYELGAKAEVFDGRLALEAALYHSNWKDVAVRIPIGDTGYNGLLNSGGTRTTGAELSAALQLAEGFSLSAEGAYTHATYAAAVPGTGIRAGDNVEDVPRFTASATAEYSRTVTGSVVGFGRIGWQHGSKRSFSAFPSYLPGDSIDRVDMRAGIGTGRWSLSLFIENATNESGAESYRMVQPIAPGAFDVVSNRPRPRTFGLELGVMVR
ncbi:TonB-dependent receptor (plasmid) [Novosphingobium resinovorum]|uniref:TonB-dependent receptor n=1 Tax=Novosphingobium TaxID=165696 RepID=UPI001B3C4D5C|nr:MULTISPECIES: TonB-dependent receptor [Novosphingobium]MBF7015284.1 TonB-dependent receptor [Novosphingobium sp. HR1a]WJM29963.1 TonB-dependent receptor [Novosphingobium resinovorum]